MSLIPYPDNEKTRLQALHSLKLMQADFQTELDETVQLAAELLKCPIALISLVEEDFQWFKAKCGLDVTGTNREDAFCAHAIMNSEPLIVADASVDPVFKTNPLVTGELGIRFYAGIPLSTDGTHFLGTLCVIDKVPRKIDDQQIQMLKRLASLVEGFFKANEATVAAQKAKEQLALNAQLFEQAGEIAGIGAWQANVDTGEVHWSDQVFRTHDLEPGHQPTLEEALAFYPGHERQIVAASIEHTLETGAPFEFDADFVTASGRQRRVRGVGALKSGKNDERMLVGVFMDITDQYEAHKKLIYTAQRDPLTKLLNRTAFIERIERHFKSGPPMGSLLLMDLDEFKVINDTLGHEGGDQVLIEIANRLRSVVGLAGDCARLGGDEFAVFVPCDSEPVAAAILEEIAKPIECLSQHIQTALTIGSVDVDQTDGSLADLYKLADIALYRGKAEKKGGHVKYQT